MDVPIERWGQEKNAELKAKRKAPLGSWIVETMFGIAMNYDASTES
jgi:hypothetical protein